MSTCQHYVVAKVRQGSRPFHVSMRPCGQPAVTAHPHPACVNHAPALAVSS